MSRRGAPAGASTIPGTAVSLPRRSVENVLAARPVPAVEGQIDLVDHWLDCGLLDDEQRAALEREQQ